MQYDFRLFLIDDYFTNTGVPRMDCCRLTASIGRRFYIEI